MRIGSKLLLVAVVSAAVLQRAGAADEKPAFKDEKEKASYAVGIFVGNQIKRSNMDVDLNTLLSAVNDVLAGKELRKRMNKIKNVSVIIKSAPTNGKEEM